MPRILLFNKPYNVLCQFRKHDERATLADFIDRPGYYPAGRLDRDSEGLLVLTNDGALQHKIAHPEQKMTKTYWVQIEGRPADRDLDSLRSGVPLNDGMTSPAKCRLCDEPAGLWPRVPPIRVRRTIPDTWIEITLGEGRNRQVRRMCAAVGFPVLRLVRYRVGSWTLDGLTPGAWRLLD